MKRALFLLAAMAALTLADGSARASAPRVLMDRFHGPFAEAGWEQTTSTSDTEADTLVSWEQDGTTHLNIHKYTSYLDSSGNVTGSVEVSGALRGAAVTFDTVGLTTASASGTVPVTRCSFDAANNPTGCEGGTLEVSEAWTGQGDIFRGSFDENHVLVPGDLVVIDRLNGTYRVGDATASIGGQVFGPPNLAFTDFGVSNQLTVTICPHGC